MTIKPDIIEIIQSEGIDLKQRGHSFWALCPFHAEKTPSFKVDPEKGLFYCFGCGEGGDVIDFVMKLKDFSFIEALKYLGLDEKGPSKKEIQRQRLRLFLIKKYKKWVSEYHSLLADVYRISERLLMNCKTLEDIERMAWWLHMKPIIEYKLDLLNDKDEAKKLNLYREYRRRGLGLQNTR